jgi:hypothetical protein
MRENPLISWSTQNLEPAPLSSAILFGKIQEMASVTDSEGQSAGNCKGSSETTREALHTHQGSLSEMSGAAAPAKPTTAKSFSSLTFKRRPAGLAEGRFAARAAERSEKYNQVFVRFVLSQQEAEGFDLMTEGPSSPGPKIADPSGFGES